MTEQFSAESRQKMPNVLMVAQKYKPHVGGVEKHIEHVSKYLAMRDYSITLLTTDEDTSLPEHETIGPVDVVRFPSNIQRSPFRLARWFRANRALLQASQLVHCHDFLPILLWMPPLRAILPGRPVFATYHGYEQDPVPPRFRILRRISEHLIEGSICIGSFIGDVYGTRCSFTSLGAVSSSTKRASGHSRVVYVGRLERDTPILAYVDALGHLAEKYDVHVTLTACGDGALRDEVEAYALAKGITAEFPGSTPDPAPHYLSAEIALAGGFLSILEAMSYGLPVIAYSGTSLKQQYYKSVLAAGGNISIQSTAGGVAREIGRLMASCSLYESVSKQGILFAERNDWGRMAETYAELWRGAFK
jgi:glycosyltransferase involved in cell wall biosynthesis